MRDLDDDVEPHLRRPDAVACKIPGCDWHRRVLHDPVAELFEELSRHVANAHPPLLLAEHLVSWWRGNGLMPRPTLEPVAPPPAPVVPPVARPRAPRSAIAAKPVQRGVTAADAILAFLRANPGAQARPIQLHGVVTMACGRRSTQATSMALRALTARGAIRKLSKGRYALA